MKDREIEPWWLGLPPDEYEEEIEQEEDEDQIQEILAEMRCVEN